MSHCVVVRLSPECRFPEIKKGRCKSRFNNPHPRVVYIPCSGCKLVSIQAAFIFSSIFH